jgi:hypothetical protein
VIEHKPSFGGVVEDNNIQRYCARRAHSRRMHTSVAERGESIPSTSGRALPREDSSPSLTGFALALFFLIVCALALGFLVLVYALVAPLVWLVKRLRG